MAESEFRWDIFISHASEDRESVALPLSNLLVRLGVVVWVDNEELLPGDPLSQEIYRGLAQSRYGAVILSHNFFRKEWPRKELEALLLRERNGARVVVPILHGVSYAEAVAFSHALADRVAADTSAGLETVASKIARVIERNKRVAGGADQGGLLSRRELADLTAGSADPRPWGPVRREGMNAHLSDAALRELIKSRNGEAKPTYLLRQEYEQRLVRRGL